MKYFNLPLSSLCKDFFNENIPELPVTYITPSLILGVKVDNDLWNFPILLIWSFIPLS